MAIPRMTAAVSRAIDDMDDTVGANSRHLYSMASMLVGEGEQSVRLMESAIANAEVSACQRLWKRRARAPGGRWVAAALKLLASATAVALAAPDGLEPASTCIGGRRSGLGRPFRPRN